MCLLLVLLVSGVFLECMFRVERFFSSGSARAAILKAFPCLAPWQLTPLALEPRYSVLHPLTGMWTALLL